MRTQHLSVSWVKLLWHTRFGVILQSVLIGIGTGFVVLGFRIALGYSEHLRTLLYAFLPESSPLWTVVWILFLAALGVFLGFLSKLRPMIRGSGIPQIKGELRGIMWHRWLSELPLKFVSAILSIGAGLSLGREGPSVQMGGYIGKAMSRIGHRSPAELRYLMISGGAAGLSAAFNAPLAGVLFALEELHKQFSPLMLLCAMAASAMGDFVSSHFFGMRPSFSFPDIIPLSLNRFPWLILLGLLAAAGGDLFKKSLYFSQSLYSKLHVPMIVRPVVPLLVSVPLGFFLAETIGGGHELVEHLAVARYSLVLLAGLFFVKLAFSGLSYGAGTAGGIFLPLLVCGALLGTAFGTVLFRLGLVAEIEIVNFLILGMAAFFTAVVRAPVTGTVLILEMSGNLSHLGGLVIVCLISQLACDLVRSRPVYDVLLYRQARAAIQRKTRTS
ncbi:MAG TPA: ClC family H(+)/Cl(-) exchange transporter [Treponemataceae bacterium]|nr:ClC family H(+)/Cl(-) exchange transporter [Treponemataceae bacterium]